MPSLSRRCNRRPILNNFVVIVEYCNLNGSIIEGIAIDLVEWVCMWAGVPIARPNVHGQHTICRLCVIVGGFGASCRENADLIIRECFAPYVTVQAGIWAVGTAVGVDATCCGGVVLSGLTSNCGCDADIVGGICLTPDIAFQTR